MRKLLNRWRLTSLNISILRPFVKSIDVFASLISILSSVALVICACFICFILILCSYKLLCMISLKLWPCTVLILSLNSMISSLSEISPVLAIFMPIPGFFEVHDFMQKHIVLLYWNNYFYAEFFHNSFKRSYFINWRTICKTLIWIY